MELEVIDNTKVFILPTYMELPISPKATSDRNKKRLAEGKPFNRYWLNKNLEGNQNRFVYNNLKKAFAPLIIPGHFKADRIIISYKVERIQKRKYDTWNVLTIVDKFFCDFLVKCQYIEDDNCDIVSHGYTSGTYGDLHDRCIATIEILYNDPTQGILF